ncbi:hypothetical protein [Treponema sp. R6D11]
MNKRKQFIFLLFITAIFTINCFSLHAQITVSGLLDSSLQATAGDTPGFSLGMEEYANIRFQSKIRDRAAVYGAVNLIAATGNYAANAEQMAALGIGTPFNSTSYVYGENYIAGIELERLYFRLSGESVNFDGGLMRLPFGYGQVWGSSDFLNPRNPLKTDARPRAILGTSFFWYPTEETKLNVFYSAPRDPFSQYAGSFVGLSFDKHWNKASIQTLYCYETPKISAYYGIHRAGLSVKADLVVGLVIDTLYTYNYEAETKLDGLSFSGGADYSFFDGKLIFLAEYLYNGENSSTAFNPKTNLLGLTNTHYLYTSLTLRFTDYTNMSAAVMIGFDDTSYIPILTLNHDLFQGATLIVLAQMPYEYYFVVSTKLRLRF